MLTPYDQHVRGSEVAPTANRRAKWDTMPMPPVVPAGKYQTTWKDGRSASDANTARVIRCVGSPTRRTAEGGTQSDPSESSTDAAAGPSSSGSGVGDSGVQASNGGKPRIMATRRLEQYAAHRKSIGRLSPKKAAVEK